MKMGLLGHLDEYDDDEDDLMAMDLSARVAKIGQYETFLNDVLKTDLKTNHDRLDELTNESAQYLELQTVLQKLGDANKVSDTSKLKTRVDIGCNFYVQAVIPSLKEVSVDIGCGIWLPMTPPDALKFCAKKLEYLNLKEEELRMNIIGIKAQIQIVLQGLRELQNIIIASPEPRPRYES